MDKINKNVAKVSKMNRDITDALHKMHSNKQDNKLLDDIDKLLNPMKHKNVVKKP